VLADEKGQKLEKLKPEELAEAFPGQDDNESIL
jgi:hypothetical protein